MIERTRDGEGMLCTATQWLELIDRGEFQAGWRSACPRLAAERRSANVFAAGTTEQTWRADVGNIRSRLGDCFRKRGEITCESQFESESS